jgi:dienelactone hydrolase
MAEVLLFHHIHGLTAGVLAFADRLREAGHTVHTPDSFEGRTFKTIDEGAVFARETGFAEISDRGLRAADSLPAELVYAGFSLGAVPAQQLAQTRPGARGALLFHAALPISEFGSSWPAGVPVQIHTMENDPYFEEAESEAAQALVETAQAGLFVYPGDKHLFADSSLPAYDPDAAALLIERVLEFLARV